MRKLTIILLLLTSKICTSYAQDTVKVDIYKSTDDYIAKKATDKNVSLVVKEVGDSHIWIKKFIDDSTGKSLNKLNQSWAITYKGSTFLNLGYTNDLNNWKIFLKLNLEGSKFCSSFIDEETPNIVKNSGSYYGGGLTGVLIKESNKWGKNWIKQNGSKTKILFVNLTKQNQPFGNRYKSSLGYFITKKELVEKLQLKKTDDEIASISFEEAITMIDKANLQL